MNSSRLIQLLEDLSRKELRELQQFIHCEFFHSNRKQYEKVLQLFLALISPRFKILKPDRRELAIELFGESNDSDRNLSLHVSQAIDLVQKYMVQKYQSQDTMRFESALLNTLENRGLSGLFEQLKSKLQRDLSRETKKGSRHFYTSYHIADISLEVKRIRDKTLTYNNVDLEVAISNLDLFFLINQLNYACNVVNTRRILQAPKYEFPLLENIVDKLPNTPYFDLPLIEVYWNSYKMLFTDNKVYYSTLKLLLFNHYPVLIKYHQINLFNHLQNYCIQKINSGDSTYYAELWEISIFRLENGLIKELSPASYKNLITTGVMLALQQGNTDFAAVLQFTENHTAKLPIEYREEAQTYAESYIAFYQNHFQVVPQKLIVNQEPLTLYKFEDIFYQIDARRLLVMTYFCLEDEEDNFDKLCSNQSVFLSERRELIPELELEKNRQFLVIIKRLFWIHGSRMERTEQLQQLKKEIEEAENISDRIWLLKQVEAKLK